MSIFSGTELPEWLNPGEDVFKVGQQAAQTFGRNFSESFAQAHQEKVNKPLKDLQLESAKLGIANEALNLQRNFSMQQSQVAAKAAESAFASIVSALHTDKDWTSPETQSAIWSFASKNPSIIDAPIFKQTIAEMDKAKAAKDVATYHQQIADTRKAELDEKVRHNKAMEESSAKKADADNAPLTKSYPGFGTVLYSKSGHIQKIIPEGGDVAKEISNSELSRLATAQNADEELKKSATETLKARLAEQNKGKVKVLKWNPQKGIAE